MTVCGRLAGVIDRNTVVITLRTPPYSPANGPAGSQQSVLPRSDFDESTYFAPRSCRPAGCGNFPRRHHTQAQAETLRIGTRVALKAEGTLEKRLAEQGMEVMWTEFPRPAAFRRAECRLCGSHDVSEAVAIADRVILVEGGQVGDVQTAAGTVTSVITTRSVRELNLKVGSEVIAFMTTAVSIAKL